MAIPACHSHRTTISNAPAVSLSALPHQELSDPRICSCAEESRDRVSHRTKSCLILTSAAAQKEAGIECPTAPRAV